MIVQTQGTEDRISYKAEGSVGSRVFTYQASPLSRYGGDTGDDHNYQMKLFEVTNVIELHYGNWVADSLDTATIGMEDYAGLDGDGGPNNTNTNSARPGFNYRFTPKSLWTGLTSTNWATASNWSDGVVPTATEPSPVVVVQSAQAVPFQYWKDTVTVLCSGSATS